MPKTRTTKLKPTSRDALPDNSELLKDMLWAVLESNGELAQSNGELAQSNGELAQSNGELAQSNGELAQSNGELAQKIAWLQRMLFGKKSERLLSPDQLDLFEKAKKRLGLDQKSETPARMPTGKAKTRRGGARKKTRGTFVGGTVPKDTPVQTSRIDLQGETCPECGETLTKLGEDSRKRVAWITGHFVVRETIVETGFCVRHPAESLFTPEGPDFIVPGGVLDNGLLNKIIVDKFADGLPLNRQAKRFRRKGVHLNTSTLSRNVIAHAALAGHLVSAMRAELLQSAWLQGDATSLPILVGDRGEAHVGQLWVYSNGETAVFQSSMTKHGVIPKTFLEGFTGVWLADGASNYNEVARMPGVERAGCWAHARRYVFDARKDHVGAVEGLQLVRDLFMGEREAMLLDLPGRRAHREAHATRHIAKLRGWVDEHKSSEHVLRRGRSPFAKAITYLDNQWPLLVRFLKHPEIPVHNNRSELLLRTPVMGRKAWLFAGSPAGADAAAVEFSLVASCMLQGIDPGVYLDDVMPSLGKKTPAEVAELTPAKWALQRREVETG